MSDLVGNFTRRGSVLKGTATLRINIFYKKELYNVHFDTSFIKIGGKMGKLWAFKEFNMADIESPF